MTLAGSPAPGPRGLPPPPQPRRPIARRPAAGGHERPAVRATQTAARAARRRRRRNPTAPVRCHRSPANRRQPRQPSACRPELVDCSRIVYTIRRRVRNCSRRPPRAHPANPPQPPPRPSQHAPVRDLAGRAGKRNHPSPDGPWRASIQARMGRPVPQEFFGKNSYARKVARFWPPIRLSS